MINTIFRLLCQNIVFLKVLIKLPFDKQLMNVFVLLALFGLIKLKFERGGLITPLHPFFVLFLAENLGIFQEPVQETRKKLKI